MRSGRLDRKIEFPHPTEEARARILQVWTTLRSLFVLCPALLSRVYHWDFLYNEFPTADSFKEDERTAWCELRGVGPLHWWLQWSSTKGCLRWGWNVGTSSWCHWSKSLQEVVSYIASSHSVVFWALFYSYVAPQVTHEDFNDGIIQVQAKKKASLNYYA